MTALKYAIYAIFGYMIGLCYFCYMQTDIKTTTEVVEVGNDSEKSSRETYPIKPFKSIEIFVGNVYKKYGDNGVHSNQTIAEANNLSTNSIKQTLSTSQQYGTMQRIHGEGYRVTDRFTKIFHPENEDQRNQAIIECIKGVPFYIPLFADYNEKIVPSIEGLTNRFVREFKMKSHIAKNAAEVFLRNLRDFNLITSRGVLMLKSEIKQPDNSLPKTPNDTNDGFKLQNSNVIKGDDVKIPIRLKGGKMAYLSFPSDFTDEDLIKIFKVLKAYIEAYGENINLNDLAKA